MLQVITFVMSELPLIMAAGSILAVVGGMMIRVGACHNVMCLASAVHPSAAEIASLTSAIAVIKLHFAHKGNAQAIQAQAQPPQPAGGTQA